MAMSVYVVRLIQDAGRMTATVVIQPSALAAFRIEIVFEDRGNQEGNLHHVQGILQSFSADLAEALRRPLKIVPTPEAAT